MTIKRQTLREMVESRYDDAEICEAILADVAKNKTEEGILAGKLTLPTATDAKHWHERVTGKALMTPTERSQEATIKAMQERLLVLETGGKEPVK